MKLLLFSQKYMYELFLDDDGKYFFDVVVGWISWFTKRVQLSEEQIRKYQEKGEEYLNSLSSEVNAQGILEARRRKYEYESLRYGTHQLISPTDWENFKGSLSGIKIIARQIQKS